MLNNEAMGRPHGGKLVEVSTIDGFQGRERGLIIFSAVNSETHAPVHDFFVCILFVHTLSSFLPSFHSFQLFPPLSLSLTHSQSLTRSHTHSYSCSPTPQSHDTHNQQSFIHLAMSP